MFVIDASVYVALIKADEEANAKSWAWFQKAQDEGVDIFAPVIIASEVAAAVSRGINSPALAHEIVGQLFQYNLVKMVPVSIELAKEAASIAAEYRVRGCDAVYIALAQQEKATLVTLDRQQLSRGSGAAEVREP